MKKALSALTFFTLLSLYSFSQQPFYVWASNAQGWLQGVSNITVDNNGNSYVIGDFNGTVDFDPGPDSNIVTSVGSNNVFISKYDSQGNYVWTNTYGNTGDWGHGFSICSDDQNNIYCIGQYNGLFNFNPTGSNGVVTSNGSNAIYILKLDSDGNFIWVKSIKSSRSREIIYKNNFLYYCGSFIGTVDFNPNSGNNSLTSTSGSRDGFISKLDLQGNYIWAKKIGGSDDEGVSCLAVDDLGVIYCTGSFEGTVDFDPGPSTYNMTAATGPNGVDGFILKLNSIGDFVWCYKLNGDNMASIGAIDLHNSNEIYFTGGFHGSIDLSPLNPSYQFSNPTSASDAFLFKIDSTGIVQWGKHIIGIDQDIIFDLNVDSSNNAIIGGTFGTNLNLDYGFSNHTLTTPSNNVVASFIAKYNNSGGLLWGLGQYGDFHSGCRGIDLNKYGNIYALGSYDYSDFEYTDYSGTYHLTGNSAEDNNFIVRINDCFQSTSTITIEECGSYVSPSENYNWVTSGNYFDTIPNSRGCDSIINIDLTIYPYGYSQIDTSVCDSYNSPGGQNLFSTGIYYDTIANPPNCDSIIEINLTVNAIDNNVSINGATLQSLTSGASYQWLDCENNMNPITGANGHSFTPLINGSYAVIINLNDCIDTSSCQAINNVGISNISEEKIIIYPNPNSGTFTISGVNSNSAISILISDMSGRIVFEINNSSSQTFSLQPNLSTGIYWIEVKNGLQLYSEKLVIE